MGRAERRREERSAIKALRRTPTYTVTKAELDKMVSDRIAEKLGEAKEEATNDAINAAMVLLLTLPLEVLLNHFWQDDTDKLTEFTELVLDYYQKWQNGELDMEQMKDDLWNYGGVKLMAEE